MRGGERVEYHSEKIKIRQQVRMATSALLDERAEVLETNINKWQLKEKIAFWVVFLENI